MSRHALHVIDLLRIADDSTARARSGLAERHPVTASSGSVPSERWIDAMGSLTVNES
jgi:hypothetical protein